MRSGLRTVKAENGETGGMQGRVGLLRQSEGAETGTHDMGEEGHGSAEYEIGCAL